MCFSLTSSLIMTGVGIAISTYAYFKINKIVAFGLFYFTLMEIIQSFGYLVINKCSSKLNIFLAYANFIHIAFQPFVFTLMIFGLLKFYNLTSVKYESFKYILIFSFIASLFVLSRLWGKKSINCDLCASRPCISRGKHHLKIETPLRTDPEYFTPNFFIHFIFFFIPVCFLGPYAIAISVFILITFLLLTHFLKLGHSEASTTWCLASSGQFLFVIIFVILFGRK